MKIDQAKTIAQSLIIQMTPFCERVEIAGSIRRECEEVNDIEIVAVPKWREVPDVGNLFESAVKRVNCLHEWAISNQRIQWIKTNDLGPDGKGVPWHIEPEGRHWKGILKATGVKLDLFLCQRANWGTIMLIRTGNRKFSRAVVMQAAKCGLYFDDGKLKRNGAWLETFEERDVFARLDLQYIEPPLRCDPYAVRRIRRTHIEPVDDLHEAADESLLAFWNGDNESPAAQRETRNEVGK